MKGKLGVVLLALGLAIAAAFGARNGEQHLRYRAALAQNAEPSVPLPAPEVRLRQWFAVGGTGWLAGMALIVIGATLARAQRAADNDGTSPTSGPAVDFVATLEAIRTRVEALQRQIADLEMDADSTHARETIDGIQAELIQPLVEGRGQLIARHGLAGFAEYFGTFSAAERNLNRCWSALTDGHAFAAREALATATRAFADALERYQEVDARG